MPRPSSVCGRTRSGPSPRFEAALALDDSGAAPRLRRVVRDVLDVSRASRHLLMFLEGSLRQWKKGRGSGRAGCSSKARPAVGSANAAADA